jgi:hypothetical protein
VHAVVSQTWYDQDRRSGWRIAKSSSYLASAGDKVVVWPVLRSDWNERSGHGTTDQCTRTAGPTPRWTNHCQNLIARPSATRNVAARPSQATGTYIHISWSYRVKQDFRMPVCSVNLPMGSGLMADPCAVSPTCQPIESHPGSSRGQHDEVAARKR